MGQDPPALRLSRPAKKVDCGTNLLLARPEPALG